MDMSGMNMTTMDGMSFMPSSQMAMVFFNSHMTPLYSMDWLPTSSGGYAGTCIFLIILSIIHRSLLACKAILELRWREQAWNRRYIVVADKVSLAEKLSSKEADADSTTGVLSANGVEESVRLIRHDGAGAMPWRFSVDLPRAIMTFVIAGVAYLLMLAVMTLNVGYFLSVIAGVFVGELMVGRYSSIAHNSVDSHH